MMDEVFGNNEKAKVLWESILSFCEGNEVVAHQIAWAAKRKMDELFEKRAFPSTKIKQLKAYLRKVGSHSVFSYIQKWLMDGDDISEYRLLKIFLIHENLPSNFSEEYYGLLLADDAFREFLEISISYTQEYLRWYCASVDSERQAAKEKMEEMDDKRMECYWALRTRVVKGV